MSTDIDRMIDLMERTFRDFESSAPSKPQLTLLSFGPTYRFRKRDIYQAMILKLARVLSTVQAARVLCDAGYGHKQAILCRTIDEANEDIVFLAYAVTNDSITDLRTRYLEAFWEDEIDEAGTMLNSALSSPPLLRFGGESWRREPFVLSRWILRH